MARRKRSYLEREFRRAAWHMRPNRVTARFASGGRHQTWKAIVASPFKEKTVQTPKSGRRAYRQYVARERKAQAKAAAQRRKLETATWRSWRAEQRAQQPRAPHPRRSPVAVNARTGKPITWQQAQAAVNAANWEAARIEAELAGTRKPVKPRAPRTSAAPKSPLQSAIAEVKAKQTRQQRARAKNTAARKPGGTATAKPAKTRRPKSRKGFAEKVADLIPDQAILTPAASGRTAVVQPKRGPSRTKGRKGLYGAVLAATCECRGTGRIPVLDEKGDPNGSTSCPDHGRAGKMRGAKHWTPTGAIRDSGLPGLGQWLVKRRHRQRGNSDKRQHEAWTQARRQVRHAGPTLECGNCDGGLVNRHLTDRLRKQRIMKARADAAAVIRAAEAHNAEVDATGVGKKVKVPKMPPEKQLQTAARLAYPYDLCSACKGLGRVETSARLLHDGQQPVAEWRATALLKDGHRLTGRERTTGRRPTKNAARVERRRTLPRI